MIVWWVQVGDALAGGTRAAFVYAVLVVNANKGISKTLHSFSKTETIHTQSAV